MKLSDFPEDCKPREKLLKLGVNSLSNVELFAILLRTGTRNLSCIELAEGLLKNFEGDLKKFSEVLKEELLKINGIGKAKACSLLVVFELARRLSIGKVEEQVLNTPEKVAKFFIGKFTRLSSQEEFHIICLDVKNKFIGHKRIHIGSIDKVDAQPKEIFHFALRWKANKIILAHNHPSGDVTPSIQDEKITQRIKKLGEELGIAVVDHIILSGNLSQKKFYVSFNELSQL